jgi:hypothetical protein
MEELVFYDRKKTIRRAFPSQWSELHHAKANDVLTILSKDKDDLENAVKRLLSLPPHLWRKIKADEDGMLDDMLDLTAMFIPSPDPIPYIQWFMYNKSKYRLPEPYFDRMSAVEFTIASEYLKSYFDTKDAIFLCKLTSVLARPVLNGVRVPIEKRSDAEALEPLFADLPDGYALACFYYFRGCHAFAEETYHILYDAQNDDIQLIALKAIEHAPDFGLWGTLLSVAKTGVFGTYEQVLKTPMHSIFLYLCEQKKLNLMEKAVSDYFKEKSKTKQV